MAKLSVEQTLTKAKSHSKKGEITQAQELYVSVLRNFPNNKKAQQGLTALGGGQLSAAEQGPPQAVINQLMSLYKQGQLQLVVRKTRDLTVQFTKATALWSLLGASAAQIGQLDQAVQAFEKMISINPNEASSYYNLGNVLQEQGKLKKAIEAYNKAIALKSDYAEAYNNIGLSLQELGNLDEAIDAYNKALNIKSDYAAPHHNMSLTLLAAKDFDQGFKQNEWRWETKEFKGKYLTTSKPMWNGEKRQRILVWGEQGIGDEIMFSSIIPELYTASSQILVKCDKRLIPLFERSFPADIIYLSKGQLVPEDEYDFHIPVGSLPLTFRKSLDSFEKSSLGFLKCDTAKVRNIKDQLTHEQSKKLVGISWTTKSALRNASNRNINLADLARAFDSSNTQLVCLQYGDVSDEIEAVKRDFGIDVIQFGNVDNKNDIDGLASLMGACDMVVTIDNATAHLSGALGVPTKLMLPYIADWRWSIAEDSSYWYGALQLYRQSKVNDWHSVLALITQVMRA